LLMQTLLYMEPINTDTI